MTEISHYNSLLFEIYALKIYEMFIYNHTGTIEYVKK